MVSKKDRDAESGLQVLSILGIFWTIGFFYWTGNDIFLGNGMNPFLMSCCNIINFIITLVFFASWRYTRKENRAKDFLEEYMITSNSVSVKFMADRFRFSDVSAARIFRIWLTETAVRGDYDMTTGIFRKEPVETVSPEIIDIEFQDVPDEQDTDDKAVLNEEPGFCPDCGGRLTTVEGSDGPWCGNCNKHIQSK
jgi:putative hemolysin